ncbi:MAG: glutamine synthetase family protein [Alphaproteobacteria bacterium]|nr:glutamine synthetase family protein [Alphaproteobacteria bacterium]
MERLRILGCDHLNLARGKYMTIAKADSQVTRICQGVYAVTYKRDLLPAPGSKMLEGLPDMEMRWQMDDIRDGWEENTKIVIADFAENATNPLPVCGRSALKKALADWQDLGYSVKIGIELEAHAFIRDDNNALQLAENSGSFVYATGTHADPLGFTDAIWQAAHQMGFPLEVITTEYDASQYEFVLTFDDALKAVDDIFLFKQMAREIALECGVVLAFMPKPVAESGGNGVHINFSLWKDGKNAISTSEQGGAENLSDIAKAVLAGLLQHHKSLAGLLAPTVNSYERLKPASLSGYWANWGIDHRSVTARVSSEGGQKARIEHRLADAGANPYTAVAAMLQAGRLGFINTYQLPAMEVNDGLETINTDIHVADNLAGALDDLAADKALTEAVGQILVDNHIFIKRAEIEEVAACDNDIAKRDYYIHFL